MLNILIVGESSVEMKPEADVNECPHDDKPSTGLFTVSVPYSLQ